MMNIVAVLDRAKLHPKKEFAVLHDGETVTYGNLLSTVDKLSIIFNRLSLKQGDKIVLSTDDKRSLVEITVAAYRYGLTVILTDPNAKADRIHSIIASARPDAFFIDSVLTTAWRMEEKNIVEIKKVSEEKKNLFKNIFSRNGKAHEEQASSNTYPACLKGMENVTPLYPSDIDPSCVAYMMYTSGSTSDPKGVVISHKNLFSHLETLKKVYGMNDEVKILNVLNLYHTDGINQGPFLALYSGGTWVSPFKLDTSRLDLIYDGIYKYKITHCFVAPTLLSFFEKYHEGFEDSFQTPDFKFAISVAAMLEERLWHSVSSIFKIQIVNIYGLTETVTGSIYCGPSLDTFKIGTVGKPTDCSIKIIDEGGREVTKGEKGELLLKGDHIMVGYFNNPEATSAVLADGWLYSGDIAREDEDGFVKIVGRKKSMINAGGFRVQPEEVEEILLKMEEMDECKVIGMPDPILTEKMIACVKLKDKVVMDELTLYKYLRENLEPEKVPQELCFIDTFPRGISGKIQVEELKKIVTAKHAVPITKSEGVLDTVVKIAASIFKVEHRALNEQSSTRTVSGWDSLNHLALITKLEQVFNVKFTTSDIMVMTSISSIQNVIHKKLR
ncbi:MAG TPA: AMP-binding protein [Chryseolinea sp.]|nr:AMP-binding protein [Chryseolinea sp.]